MPFHFSDAEYAARLSKAAAALQARDLEALLLFAPESHYWICGYDTFGFAMFQCLILGADGRLNLLTRAPDLRQAQQTSTLSDAQIHIWKDIEGVSPANTLAGLVKSLGYSGKIAMETETPGSPSPTASPSSQLLTGVCTAAMGSFRICAKINHPRSSTCTAAPRPSLTML